MLLFSNLIFHCRFFFFCSSEPWCLTWDKKKNITLRSKRDSVGSIQCAVNGTIFLSCSRMVPNTGGVCSLDSTFNTLRYSESCFMCGAAPHGSDSLCKQNLKQNRPPVNSRQPGIDTFPTQSHFHLLHCFWKTTLLCLKKTRNHMRDAPRCRRPAGSSAPIRCSDLRRGFSLLLSSTGVSEASRKKPASPRLGGDPVESGLAGQPRSNPLTDVVYALEPAGRNAHGPVLTRWCSKTPAVIKVILICLALPCLSHTDVLPIDFLTSLVSFPSPARQHPEESVNGALLTPVQSSFTCCSHKDPFTLNIHYRSAE